MSYQQVKPVFMDRASSRLYLTTQDVLSLQQMEPYGMGGFWDFLTKSLKGGTGYYTKLVLKNGQTFTGEFEKGSDGLWHNILSDGTRGAFSWSDNEIASKEGGGRVGQGWLATIFGGIGGGAKGITKLASGLYSVFNKSTNQYEQKTYAQLTPTEQTQVNTSSIIPGVSNTVFLVGVGAVVLMAFVMSKKKGQQQPIIIGGQ